MERIVLHVGCGYYNPKTLHKTFQGPEWSEIRFDINPGVNPDIVGSIIDMSQVASESVDAVWSSHNLEHLYPHEVPLALKEFYRVLKLNGFALIALPDLQRVAELVAADKLEEVIYQSPAGPISPIDVIFGFRPALETGNLFMSHKTGFTASTIRNSLLNAGFARVSVERDDYFNLWARAEKA